MKVGLLADIHGNLPALQAVLWAARNVGVEAIIIAGDFVGYYYWPSEVLELLAPWPKFCVSGNHEIMLFNALSDERVAQSVEKKYGSGLRAAMIALAEPQVEWLRALPISTQFVVGGMHMALAHGTPRSVDQYVYADTPMEFISELVAGDTDLLVLGHTHHQMTSHAGNLAVINPGSVGQPRDRRPGAAWALLDTDTGSCQLRREAYDIRQVVDEAKRRDPSLPYLWEVLSRT
jgi:putative phosphoesterase